MSHFDWPINQKNLNLQKLPPNHHHHIDELKYLFLTVFITHFLPKLSPSDWPL